MALLRIPTAAEVRARQEGRKTAENRRKHYLGRIAAAKTKKQQMAEAFDYLRSTVKTNEEMDQAVTELVAMADRIGGVQ